ncbi:unnamed protein product [Discula destructiva]
MSPPAEKAGLTLTTMAPVGPLSTEDKSIASADTLAVSPAGSIAGFDRPSNVSTPATAQLELNPFDTDLEAMVTNRTLAPGDDACGMKSTSNCNLKGCAEGQVWPGQAHWKKKAKAAKVNKRSCQLLAKLSKRNRILVKVFIGLLVIALGLGVGLGISRKLGAAVWKPDN